MSDELECKRDVSVARAISLGVGLTLMAAFGAMAFGCHETKQAYQTTYTACVKAGGSYISANDYCLQPGQATILMPTR